MANLLSFPLEPSALHTPPSRERPTRSPPPQLSCLFVPPNIFFFFIRGINYYCTYCTFPKRLRIFRERMSVSFQTLPLLSLSLSLLSFSFVVFFFLPRFFSLSFFSLSVTLSFLSLTLLARFSCSLFSSSPLLSSSLLSSSLLFSSLLSSRPLPQERQDPVPRPGQCR